MSEDDHLHHDTYAATVAEEDLPAAATTVEDYTAILHYLENDSTRWNGMTDVGTNVIVSYSFTTFADLPDVASSPYSVSAFWAFDAVQQEYFRDALALISAQTGILFVEVAGEAMINAYGADANGVGGWASYASSGETWTGSGDLVNAYSNMEPGAYGFQVNLHELGHALGLSHPHDGGSIVLDDAADTQSNTVMTYNIDNPYATDLGPFDVQALQHLYGTAEDISGWEVGTSADGTVHIETTGAGETVLGTDQTNEIWSHGGSDIVFGRQADDFINGGADADTLIGAAGNDTLQGNSHDDVIYGDYEDYVYTGGDDVLFGNHGNDHLIGGAGDDRAMGGSLNDTVDGGNGNDTLSGQSGDDVLLGGSGTDLMKGGSGDDTLTGGNGDDTMTGGSGADIFVFQSADYYETNRITDFADGIDLIQFDGMGLSLGSLSIQSFGQNATDALITIGSWFELEVAGVDAAGLGADDFLFS